METPRRFQGCPAQLSLQWQLYPGLGEMGALLHLQGGTAPSASEMAFARDDFQSGLNPQLTKARISFDPQNSRGAMAIYTTQKCGLGTY